MHIVTIFFKVQGHVQFFYEHEAHATEYFNKLSNKPLATVEYVKDDYGAELAVYMEEIRAVLLTDQKRQLDGQRVLQLEQARATALLQKQAASDPNLRFMNAQGQVGGMQFHG
jgi:predicted house-cleaning noncanonical NTP pyrophosphatase (MazG superfamily)